MVAPAAEPEPFVLPPDTSTPRYGGTHAEPPNPLTPELRSEIAYRRAQGHRWEAIGCALRYSSEALRRLVEADPEFGAVQEKAWAEATWEGEAAAMSRLRLMLNGDDKYALQAAEILVKYARERRRDDTRIAVEKLRTEAVHVRAESRAAQRAPVAEPAFPAWPPFPPEVKETEDERIVRMEREAAENAVKPPFPAEVYLWGGKHHIGQCLEPDESDIKVRVVPDWSAGRLDRMIIYWVVPETARERCRGTGIYFTEDNPEPWAAQPTPTP